MNKKIFIAVFMMLFITFAGAGIYYFIFRQISKGDIANLPNGLPKENSLLEVKKLNCQDVLDAKEKANCQAGVVKLLNSGDSSVCGDLITEADKNACRQSYIIKEAAASGDLNKCGQALDKPLASDCTAQALYSLAIQKKDKKFCAKIVNKTDQAGCLKVLTNMGVK